MKTVLVTGGAGYIGSHACKALAASGYLPVTYDNLSRGHDWAVKWGPLEHGDILDRDRLSEVVARHRPDAVVHFAALAYVGESMSDPGRYYLNNVAGTLSLLEVMRAAGLRDIVFSSSCATYGIAATPITETSPQTPINPYGASKLMVERILADYAKAYGFRPVSLRYFNAAGADPDGETGELHDPEPHLVPLLLDVAAGAKPALTVYGSDYETADGTCVRDFVHVADIAEAHVLALRRLACGEIRAAYNLGTGSGNSILEVADVAREVTGREIALITGPRRPGDPARLVADASLARRELDWAPQFSDLHTIIKTAWEWRSAQAGLFGSGHVRH